MGGPRHLDIMKSIAAAAANGHRGPAARNLPLFGQSWPWEAAGQRRGANSADPPLLSVDGRL